jgi:hypothetical protein
MLWSAVQETKALTQKASTLLVISHHSSCTANRTGIKPLYCSGDKIEQNEMGGPCSAYGGEMRRIQGFGGKTWG